MNPSQIMGVDSMDGFDKAYRAWLDEALEEYNARFRQRRFHQESCPEDHDPGDLVEIAEDGSVYPHGLGGTAYIRNAVTPWEESPHWVDWHAPR